MVEGYCVLLSSSHVKKYLNIVWIWRQRRILAERNILTVGVVVDSRIIGIRVASGSNG